MIREEEAIKELNTFKIGAKSESGKNALDLAIQLLEQEPKMCYRAFAEWVASEIFDENWEYNKDAFAELACRKLAKLGIVRAKGDEWELVKLEGEEDK
jgi:hypothetical protein